MKKIATILSVLTLFVIVTAWMFASPLMETSSAQQPAIPATEYAGAAVCAECHKSESTQFNKTPHSKIHREETATGCESCHGPGQAHVAGMRAARGDDEQVLAAMQLIFSFKGSPDENSSRCLTCHVTTHEQALFNRSEHKLQGVACQTCHSTHLTQTVDTREKDWLDNKLLKKTQPALCFDCHQVTKGQFALPNHHRVPEGLMDCTDCHNPHGTRNQPMLRQTNWEACTACHQEKRGPFVFEHAAAKVEGCATCHSPHGSVNRMMLLRTEGRFMCLQCHVNPDAPNVPHGRLGFATRGECVRCHVTIHGSHSSEFFLN